MAQKMSAAPKIVPDMAPVTQSDTILPLQYLRALAAFMVVLYHAFPQLQRMGVEGRDPVFLSSGVDIFFVISGAIMWIVSAKEPVPTGMAFLRNRIVRIVPMYWLLTTFVLAVALFLPKYLQSTTFEPLHALASYFFIPVTHPVQGNFTPLLNPGWTLNYEMFFYVVFALSLFLARANAVLRAALILLALGTIAALPLLVPVSGVAAFYTDPIIVEFAFGILVGIVYLSGRVPPSKAFYWLIAAGLGVLVLSHVLETHSNRLVTFGVPAFAIVFGALHLPKTQPGFLSRVGAELGASSYALYLSHFIVMSAMGQVWRMLHLHEKPFGLIGFVIVSSLVCVVGGLLLYWLVEKLMTRYFKSFGRARIAKPSAILVAVI